MLIVATTGQCGSRLIMRDLIEHGYTPTVDTNHRTYEDSRILKRWKPEGPIDDWAVNKLLKDINKSDPKVVVKITNTNILNLAKGRYNMMGLFRHPALWAGRLKRKGRTDRTLDFWIAHGQCMLDLYHHNPFPVIEHGDDYVEQLVRAMAFYGRRFVRSNYNPDNINGTRVKVTKAAIAMYEQLRAITC